MDIRRQENVRSLSLDVRDIEDNFNFIIWKNYILLRKLIMLGTFYCEVKQMLLFFNTAVVEYLVYMVKNFGQREKRINQLIN